MSLKIRALHPWRVSPREAREIQARLCKRLVLRPPAKFRPRLVAGADAAYSKDNRLVIAAVVVMTYDGLDQVEERVAVRPIEFPYVPGLLSFREAPAILGALKLVRSPIDVLLIDGQGVAHPRGFGLASHVGMLIGIPTVGCAKSRLFGEFEVPASCKGGISPLIHEGRAIGMVLRTRENVRPVFVSCGHRIDLGSAVHLVANCLKGFRLPEPVRRAHLMVTEARLR